MTSIRSVHPEQYIPTDPGPVDPLNKILPAIGQVHPRWRQRHAMTHGRYLSGLGGLAGAGAIAQKARDGQFEVSGGSCDFLMDGDEPDWTDPTLAENENEDDSVGTGIFDQAGGATVHADMGVFADHPAVPGYIARNPPFFVNPEIQDITADAQVLEVPGGGLNYLEHGGVNVAPPISPYARYEPYITYPCQSQFQPRQPDKWQAMSPPGAEPPLPMNTPPISANPPPPGSSIPVEQHHPTPPSHRYPSSLGPVPHPWHPPGGGRQPQPGTPGGPNIQGGTGPGGGTPQQPWHMPAGGGGTATPAGGGSQTTPPGAGLRGFGQSPSNIYHPQTYVPANTRGVPGYPPRPCNPGRRHPYGQLVPYQQIVDPIDIADPLSTMGESARPCRPCLPRGMHGLGDAGIRTVSIVDPTGRAIPIGYGQDPTAPTPTPAPAPTAASSTGPGIMSYAMAGVVLGIGAYLFVGATSGKTKR